MRDQSSQLPPSQIQREAARSTIHRQPGPTEQRYASALERYVEAVSTDIPWTQVTRRGTFPPITVADVMRRDVVTAYENALFKEIARALDRNGIDAVPVIDAGRRVVGVVTASDLLARLAGARPVPRGHRLAARGEARNKSRACTARELMTAPAITVTPGSLIVDAARLAARSRVRNLPVVDPDGVLLGMVARGDLIKLFLRPDDDIHADVVRDVVRAATHPERRHVQVSVREGVVTLSGEAHTALVARRLVHDTLHLPGVLDVRDELDFEIDDAILPRGAP
jgi:CBS-domain-containing membrane protein